MEIRNKITTRQTALPSPAGLPSGPVRDFAVALVAELESIRAAIPAATLGDKPVDQYDVITRLNVIQDRVEWFRARLITQEGRTPYLTPQMRAGSFDLGGAGGGTNLTSTDLDVTIIPVGWELPA